VPPKNTPSEFGGRTMRNGIQPRPHRPTSSEALSLLYRTGSEDGINPFTKKAAPDNGEAFAGLLPEKEQRKLKEAAGDLVKGQIWDEMVAEGNQA
jgi:hypothetical protein